MTEDSCCLIEDVGPLPVLAPSSVPELCDVVRRAAAESRAIIEGLGPLDDASPHLRSIWKLVRDKDEDDDQLDDPTGSRYFSAFGRGVDVRQAELRYDATNRHLQKLLEFRPHLPSGSITASIIGNSASSWFQSCLLDKGSADGIRKGMAVVTPLGVVGQVVSATSHSAKVLLITDANSGVDVLVQRTRARGIVSGSLENVTIMKYVKRSEDIQEGDRLITSGLDAVFPKGLMVGTVVKVRKQNLGLFQSVEVIPAVISSQTEEVLVVNGEPNQEKN